MKYEQPPTQWDILRSTAHRIMQECPKNSFSDWNKCKDDVLKQTPQEFSFAVQVMLNEQKNALQEDKRVNDIQDSRERRNFWFFGGGFLLFFIVTIFIANPTPYQQMAFRWFASIVSAGVGYNIPGFLSVDYRTRIGKSLNVGIKAGGAIAIFVIVYLINPTGLTHAGNQ